MKKKDTTVLEEMFTKHYQEWCLLSFSYVKDLDDAKDVVQNIFIKLLQNDTYASCNNMKSYIFTAVRNESLTRIKKQKKTIPIGYLGTETPSFENNIIQREISEKVLKEIYSLPDKNQKVFKLCVLEGLKYENAAEILGITVNTVKYHLKTSFKILRINLRDVYYSVLLIII
ncbi:RNA polymerase sigma factor [Flavimarina sp. Hel_I_48]|uniref:RNA polymerase sigma factor n=1 Tax=Flavimarina sp. Hel_I_48 TaxID=1392488 RepID=UPI0004DF68B3|nr:RNA polymerase sigma factor [Flavimarina sp. Hel_I_48]